jgi:dTDP-4-amino-4,6-dideoxygalactose transaminase
MVAVGVGRYRPGMLTYPRTTTAVPFLDLRPSHDGLKAELLQAFGELIDTNAFTNGPAVAAFEDSFAAYCRRTSCVGVASGLDALRLALLAANLQPGDEVIVPANTFIATLEAVSQAGATPVIVDASEDDLNLDPEAARAAIGPRTRFIMPVHLYGQLADMRTLAGLGVPLIEDACQAHGAVRDGLCAGESGIAAAFSFYPGKNLGAFGDAGALVLDDVDLADRVRALREHGQRSKYRHEAVGYTARLDTIQALVLSVKLPLLAAWNEERRAIAAAYREALGGAGDLELPPIASGSEPVWHLYVIRTATPEALSEHLRQRGVGSGFHYPEPAHLSEAYRHLGHTAGAFPVTERTATRLLSLPIFPGMTAAQVEAVIEGVRTFF